ncbi:hypothetical protein [Streptomyces sp. NPDC048611]|uniref:hypothetical protein n=1 Tax=Streptomyces sp. NPDC048611 TaxID=3155635 RepID=UPI0034381AA4
MPEGKTYMAFTGELLRLLNEGCRTGGAAGPGHRVHPPARQAPEAAAKRDRNITGPAGVEQQRGPAVIEGNSRTLIQGYS